MNNNFPTLESEFQMALLSEQVCEYLKKKKGFAPCDSAFIVRGYDRGTSRIGIRYRRTGFKPANLLVRYRLGVLEIKSVNNWDMEIYGRMLIPVARHLAEELQREFGSEIRLRLGSEAIRYVSSGF